MNIRNTYWIVSLSLLLSLSLVLPFCCDAVVMDASSNSHEMASHSTHGQQSGETSCDCGHEFVKDYQKNKKLVTKQVLPVLKLVDVSDELRNHFSAHRFAPSIKLPPGLLKKSGPSLHLLISVFLN